MYMFLRYSSENVTSVYLYGSVQHTVCCARLRMCVHFSVIFSCSNKFRCELSERPTCTFGRKLRKVIIFKGIRSCNGSIFSFKCNRDKPNLSSENGTFVDCFVSFRNGEFNMDWFLNGLWGECLLYFFFFLSSTGLLWLGLN